jgi:hypothetical protein
MNKDQIKNLMATMPEKLEEKCFLKCFGEGTDLVFLFLIKKKFFVITPMIF